MTPITSVTVSATSLPSSAAGYQESYALQIADTFWSFVPASVAGVGYLPLIVPADVSLISTADCSTRARFRAEPGSSHVIRFLGDGSVSVDDPPAHDDVLPPLKPIAPLGCRLPPLDPPVTACQPTRDLDQFALGLLADLADRAGPRLAARMHGTFHLLLRQSGGEGAQKTPEAAVSALLGGPYLGGHPAIRCQPGSDLGALLPEGDVFKGMYASAFYSTGWGIAGGDEAIVYLARLPNGQPYWLGILYAWGGFRG